MRKPFLTAGTVAVVTAAAVLAAPSGAALGPVSNEAIYLTKPPPVAHDRAQGFTVAEPGQVIHAVVTTIASEDYGEFVEGGRIEKPVGYHDSRSYLLHTSQELKRLEGRPDLRGLPRLTDIQAIVGPLIPPVWPTRSVATFKGIVGQFKQVAASDARAAV